MSPIVLNRCYPTPLTFLFAEPFGAHTPPLVERSSHETAKTVRFFAFPAPKFKDAARQIGENHTFQRENNFGTTQFQFVDRARFHVFHYFFVEIVPRLMLGSLAKDRRWLSDVTG